MNCVGCVGTLRVRVSVLSGWVRTRTRPRVCIGVVVSLEIMLVITPSILVLAESISIGLMLMRPSVLIIDESEVVMERIKRRLLDDFLS